MARSIVLVRLPGRKQEGQTNASNGGVKRVTQEKSWRRRSLASLSRRLSPGLRPKSPLPAVDSDASPPVPIDKTQDQPPAFYPRPVEVIRQEEYPHMNQGTYLDHSGATIYARSTLDRTTSKLLADLYGNPHSANLPAARSGDMVDAVRAKALRFLGADPRHFDLIFTANATAAIKLVADAFRDLGAARTRSRSFWYGYHRDAHTSLVGVRELTGGDHHVFAGDAEVEAWLAGEEGGGGGAYNGEEEGGDDYADRFYREGDGGGNLVAADRVSSLGLFAYPGQSNLTGRRLPLEWAGRLRRAGRRLSGGRNGGGRRLQDTYSLLDAAALAMTSPMAPVFADPDAAPDFVCVSFYKIFGFPDLGALVVRRESGHILALRSYFGGGTVSMVSTMSGAWHLSKGLESAAGAGTGAGEGEVSTLHEGLEDGTLPFHSILALGEAMDVHAELYGSMENVSAHTTSLVGRMYRGMRSLRYPNGQRLCRIYGDEGRGLAYGDVGRQGATVAFNVFRADGGYESYAVVEKLANERGVYVRSGGICCPGGLYAALQYEPWQLDRARSAGHHCGPNGLSLINELPTGVVRASLGAMSTVQDVDGFLAFLRDTFLGRADSAYGHSNGSAASVKSEHGEGYG